MKEIDCNCNDCKWMVRDSILRKSWLEKHRQWDFEIFEFEKKKAISDAQAVIDMGIEINSGNGMMRVAQKMKFQFDKSGLIHYGKCSILHKGTTFIPEINMWPQNNGCYEMR